MTINIRLICQSGMIITQAFKISLMSSADRGRGMKIVRDGVTFLVFVRFKFICVNLWLAFMFACRF